MRRKFMIYVLFFTFFSCRATKDIRDINNIINELVPQIIIDNKNKQFVSTNCLHEKSKYTNNSYLISHSNFKEYLKNIFKINDANFLDKQLSSFNDFKITPTISQGKKILLEIDYQSNKKIYKKWINSNCKNGSISISKPVFNETFDVAYVQIGNDYGNFRHIGEASIYKLVDDQWVKIRTIESSKSILSK